MALSGFRIATIRGIPIRIHVSFLIILPLAAYAFSNVYELAVRTADVPVEQVAGGPWMWGVALALALFLSVLLHELAHSLYAIARGAEIRGITLLVIGGVSQMVKPPKDVRDEAIMALVGPLMSLVLGGVLFGITAVFAMPFTARFAVYYVGLLNIILGVFNLLPAFPMDGGRILRSLLARRIGLIRATRVAANVGKVFAFAFGFLGFTMPNVFLLLIGFFVYLGADTEIRSVVVNALLGRLDVRDIMSPAIASVPASSTVWDAAERMIEDRRGALAVDDHGVPVGLITLTQIQGVTPTDRQRTPVSAVTVKTEVLAPDDEAGRALRAMTASDIPLVLVAEHGHMAGVVSREDLVRGLQLFELEQSQPRIAMRYLDTSPSPKLVRHRRTRVPDL